MICQYIYKLILHFELLVQDTDALSLHVLRFNLIRHSFSIKSYLEASQPPKNFIFFKED